MKKVNIDGLYLCITLIIAAVSSVLLYLFLKDMKILLSVTFFIFFAGASVYIFQFQKESMKLLMIFLFSIVPVISSVFFIKAYSLSTVILVAFSFALFSFIAVQSFYQIINDLKEKGFKIEKISLGNPQKKLSRSEILKIAKENPQKKLSHSEILKIAKENLIVMLIIFALQILVTAVFGFLYAEFRWHQYVRDLISSWSLDISFFGYFICCFFMELPLGTTFVLVITNKTLGRRLKDGFKIFLCVCCGFFWLAFFGFSGAEYLCFWNPLICTYHSNNFNINNVPKVKEGMTREEITALIGDPIEQGEKYSSYTRDDICLTGDYAWYKLVIIFEDDIAVKIDSDIICD